jgi:hypothetical protein
MSLIQLPISKCKPIEEFNTIDPHYFDLIEDFDKFKAGDKEDVNIYVSALELNYIKEK